MAELNTELLKSAHEYDEDGTPVYNIFTVLHLIQTQHQVDFWDFHDRDNDYQRWCSARGHKFNSNGGSTFALYQVECKAKTWEEAPYSPFIDVVLSQFSDETGMRYYEKVETLVGEWLIEAATKLDQEQYGHDDWRVTCANFIAAEIGDELQCCWGDS
jgi:hypothetical protein